MELRSTSAGSVTSRPPSYWACWVSFCSGWDFYSEFICPMSFFRSIRASIRLCSHTHNWMLLFKCKWKPWHNQDKWKNLSLPFGTECVFEQEAKVCFGAKKKFFNFWELRWRKIRPYFFQFFRTQKNWQVMMMCCVIRCKTFWPQWQKINEDSYFDRIKMTEWIWPKSVNQIDAKLYHYDYFWWTIWVNVRISFYEICKFQDSIVTWKNWNMINFKTKRVCAWCAYVKLLWYFEASFKRVRWKHINAFSWNAFTAPVSKGLILGKKFKRQMLNLMKWSCETWREKLGRFHTCKSTSK